jgi:hypothetical protein
MGPDGGLQAWAAVMLGWMSRRRWPGTLLGEQDAVVGWSAAQRQGAGDALLIGLPVKVQWTPSPDLVARRRGGRSYP